MLVAAVGLLAACASDTPGPSPTPSPRVTATAGASQSTQSPTAPPTASVQPWPTGWDASFCVAYADIVVAQELARDIGRAIDDEATDDAIGLTHELATTVTQVRTELADVPVWAGAEPALNAIDTLLDTDEQLVTYYLRYLEQGRDPAHQRAIETEATLRDVAVPAVEDALANLAGAGLACPGQNFTLDKP